MAYVHINSFKDGIDARRSKISAKQGSLIVGENIHVNRGGEIEKRKAFVEIAALPESDTLGLHATKFGLYVFGTKPVVTVPAGVIYQRLAAPGSPELIEVSSVDTFNSVPYVVAKFDDGSTHHFYNGKRVTDWAKLAPGIADLGSAVSALADLVDLSPDVSAVYSLVGIVHTITVTAQTENVVIPISASVNNVGKISNTAVVTIITPPASGVAQVAKIEFAGLDTSTGLASDEVNPKDTFIATVNGREFRINGAASGVGTMARVFRGKVYAPVQGLLYFSDANDPMRWTLTYQNSSGTKIDTFAGFESIAAQTGGVEDLVTVAPYQNYLAIFSRRSTQVWQVVPGDPVDNQPQQILDNVGAMAARSAVSFGQLDVFFLSDSGIRSLRARDSSNAAVVFDVGTSIDPLVLDAMRNAGEGQAAKACGVIEPRDGRYMLAIGDKVFVYSYFPTSGISAWTVYTPGFQVSDFAVSGDMLYCRSGDSIYALGGQSGSEYDSCKAVVELAWLDADKPVHKKGFRGFDAVCSGTWTVQTSTDTISGVYDEAGAHIDSTANLPNFALQSHGTHIGIRLTTNDPGRSSISSITIHFDFTEPPN